MGWGWCVYPFPELRQSPGERLQSPRQPGQHHPGQRGASHPRPPHHPAGTGPLHVIYCVQAAFCSTPPPSPFTLRPALSVCPPRVSLCRFIPSWSSSRLFITIPSHIRFSIKAESFLPYLPLSSLPASPPRPPLLPPPGDGEGIDPAGWTGKAAGISRPEPRHCFDNNETQQRGKFFGCFHRTRAGTGAG